MLFSAEPLPPVTEGTREAYAEYSYTVAAEGENFVYRYRLMRPLKVDPSEEYPLVIFLHGAGERGVDNTSQLAYLPALLALPEMRQKYPAFVLVPQCPLGQRWVDEDWASAVPKPHGAPTLSMQAVMGMLDDVTTRLPVDRQRVILTGLSMGGYGVWDLAMRQPSRFARLVPVCGGGDPKQVGRLRAGDIWAWHSADDPVVPVERSRLMIEALRAAGGSPQYSELQGAGHASWQHAYRSEELLNWMFQPPPRSRWPWIALLAAVLAAGGWAVAKMRRTAAANPQVRHPQV